MKIRSWKKVLFVVTVTSMLLSACSFSVNLGNPTPTAQPPAVNVATEGLNVTAVTNTTGSSTSTDTLSTELYKNKNGAFEINPPSGWEISIENNYQVTYTSPDGATLITVDYTNTGYTLDTTSMESYINGNEANLYSFKDGYSETSRELKLDQGSATVYKTFNYNNILQKVETIYNQSKDIVYSIELWTDEPKWDGMVDFFNQFLDSVRWYPDQAYGGAPYMLWETFTNPDQAFSYYYYYPWYPTWDYSNPILKIDVYTAPDGNAFIKSLYENDGTTTWTKGNAGSWVITNLENYLAKGVSDLVIDKDQIRQSDQFEYLEWHTKKDNWVGVTIFTANGMQIEFLTVAWQASYANIYESPLRDIIGTFTAPAQ
jgi:hypothetical protein